jgi:hypothetical protein
LRRRSKVVDCPSFRPGGSVHANGSLGVMEIVNFIEERENEAIVLVQAKTPPEFEGMAREFYLDLI